MYNDKNQNCKLYIVNYTLKFKGTKDKTL